MFGIYMMVSKIHDSVDLVLSVKILIESEAEISMRELKLNFL